MSEIVETEVTSEEKNKSFFSSLGGKILVIVLVALRLVLIIYFLWKWLKKPEKGKIIDEPKRQTYRRRKKVKPRKYIPEESESSESESDIEEELSKETTKKEDLDFEEPGISSIDVEEPKISSTVPSSSGNSLDSVFQSIYERHAEVENYKRKAFNKDATESDTKTDENLNKILMDKGLVMKAKQYLNRMKK